MINMLFSDTELMDLTLDTIRTYETGSIGSFYFYKMIEKISQVIKDREIKTNTDEIYDTFVKSIDFYNLFVKAKGIDAPLIPEEWYDIIYSCMSDVIDTLQ